MFKTIFVIIALLGSYMVYKNLSTPEYLGVKNGVFAPMPSSPNAVSSQTDIKEKQVSPLPFTHIDLAKKNVIKVLAQMQNNSIEISKKNYMHIVFITPTMRYRDDIELYFDQNASLIHYRSQSRVGYSDGGENQKRYQKFVKLYNDLN